MQLPRPVNNLPRVIRAPDQLDRELGELFQAWRDLHGVPVVIVTNLVLKEAWLADGAGYVVEVGVEGRGLELAGVFDGGEQPVAEMGPVGVVGGFDEGLEAALHLLPRASGGVAVKADGVDEGQGEQAVGMEDGEALGNAAADIVGDDMGFGEVPVGEEASEDGDLAGYGGINGWVPGAFGEAVAEQVKDVDFVAGLGEGGDYVAPYEGGGGRPVDENDGDAGAVNAMGDAGAVDQGVLGSEGAQHVVRGRFLLGCIYNSVQAGS